MGRLSRISGCAFLLTLSMQAHAGTRIAYPSSSQMYALLAGDVQVTFGTVPPKAPVDDGATPSPSPPPPSPSPSPGDVVEGMPVLSPARRSFPVADAAFVPSVRDYAMVAPEGTPSPAIEARANGFWNIRQDVFPEEQRIRMRSPMDAMLTFSIGGSSGPRGSLSIDGGVAGALWTMSQRQQAQ